ncbi:MAG: hypothetical protein AAF334_02185 [Pseudomonadota bacterium]
MRTSINDFVDRRGGAYTREELDNVLDRARRLLADLSAQLEHESDRLFGVELDEADEARIKTVRGLIAQVQKAMQTVIDIELKAGLSPSPGAGALDMEAAREEIIGRLSRLTA